MAEIKNCNGCGAYKRHDGTMPLWLVGVMIAFVVGGIMAIGHSVGHLDFSLAAFDSQNSSDSFATFVAGCGCALLGLLMVMKAFIPDNIIGGYTYWFRDGKENLHLHNHPPSVNETTGIVIREAVGGWRKRSAVFFATEMPARLHQQIAVWSEANRLRVLRRPQYGALLLEDRLGGVIPYTGDAPEADPFKLLKRFGGVADIVRALEAVEKDRDHLVEGIIALVEQAYSDRDRAKSPHAKALREAAIALLTNTPAPGASEFLNQRLPELDAQRRRGGARKGAADPTPPPTSSDPSRQGEAKAGTSQGGPAAS